MTEQKAGVELTLNVVLDQSHPSFRKHAGYLTKRIGEALLREVDEPHERREFAKRLGLPGDTPFRLTVHAVEGGGKAAG
jgi:hypothetical protein